MVPEGRTPVFWPAFTAVQSSFRVFWMVWICFNAGITTFDIIPQRRSTKEPLTLKGATHVNHTLYPNPWFGPPLANLIDYGAVYPPCMREDYRYNFAMARSLAQATLGCCEQPTINVAATTTKDECMSAVSSNNTGDWKSTICSNRPIGENFMAHVIRPCCAYLNNQCLMTSPQHCWFLQGKYHYHAEHCSQVNCLSSVCSHDKTLNIEDYKQLDGLPANYNQWWRFLSAIYIPQGVIDGVVVTLIGFPFGCILEKKIGWLRMALIHTTAGAGGHMIGSLFSSSTSVTAGGGPAFAGVLGASFILLLKDWGLVSKPFRGLYGHALSLFLMIFIGTFPKINIFSIVFGFVLGILSGFIHLPFSRKVKYLSCVILIVIMFICLFLFYEAQSHCTSCQWLHCSLYAQGWC